MPCSKCRYAPHGCAKCSQRSREVQPTEDVVEAIVNERMWAGKREFMVKWQGDEKPRWMWAADLCDNAAVTAWFERNPTSALPVNAAHLRTLCILGFGSEQAATALRLELDDVERAASRLLEASGTGSHDDVAASSGRHAEHPPPGHAPSEEREESHDSDDEDDNTPLAARQHAAAARGTRQPQATTWPRERLDGELAGWTKETRTCTDGKRKYAVYLGPSGQAVNSRAKAVRTLQASGGDGAAAAAGGGGGDVSQPAAATSSASTAVASPAASSPAAIVSYTGGGSGSGSSGGGAERLQASTLVACPVCSARMVFGELNEHVDECTGVAAEAPAAPSGPPAVAPGRRCVICLSAEKTHLILPCGHKCLCAECARKTFLMQKCPVCRGPAYRVVRVYE